MENQVGNFLKTSLGKIFGQGGMMKKGIRFMKMFKDIKNYYFSKEVNCNG